MQRHFLLLLIVLAVVAQPGCRPSEKSAARRAFKIVLDPGHGGKDAGAMGNGAPPEKEVVLDIALQVERLLKQERLNVVLTRRTDEYVSLSKRTEIANDGRATLFVSIHANSCDKEEVSGFEIYYAENGSEKEGLAAAGFIQQSIRRAVSAKDRGIRERGYMVLAQTKCPSVLIEVGYLSNAREASLLSKVPYRRKLADGIARGIIAYARRRQ
jgi:N-acetylmuramoyl-L-alanine amidase